VLAPAVANITPHSLSDLTRLLAAFTRLLYSAALCHTLASAGQASTLALHYTSSSNHSAGLKSSVQGQNSSGSVNSTSKQRQPGIQGLQPEQQLKPQADDAMLAYMQRLEEHRKRCELSGRCAAGSVLHQLQQPFKVVPSFSGFDPHGVTAAACSSSVRRLCCLSCLAGAQQVRVPASCANR
jgi:hypothetical protein